MALVAIIAGVCIAVFSAGDQPGRYETVGGNDVTRDDATSPSASTQTKIALIDRISSDAGAVIFIRLNDILDKGREKIKGLFTRLTPMVGNALEDPSSLGLDMAQPLQIHLIPQDDPNLALSGGIAGKLSDKAKFMTILNCRMG